MTKCEENSVGKLGGKCETAVAEAGATVSKMDDKTGRLQLLDKKGSNGDFGDKSPKEDLEQTGRLEQLERKGLERLEQFG